VRGGSPVRLASLRFSVWFLCSSFTTEKRRVPVFRCLRGRDRLSRNARRRAADGPVKRKYSFLGGQRVREQNLVFHYIA